MTKIIYRTGAQMREEYERTHPKRASGVFKQTKHFFRGTPVSQLLNKTDYSYFKNLCLQGLDDETAYKKTQLHIAQRISSHG